MKFLIAFSLFFFTGFTTLFATEYFVNSISGNDSNSGTSIATPWKNLSKVKSKNLQPGDIVNFARGSSWSKSAWESVFVIDNSGTLEKPITFRAYGEGELPTFSNGGQVWNKGIIITASYVIIEELKVVNTGYCGLEISKNTGNNIIRKCEVENCGMGILCYGSNNLLTENYIHEKLADPLFVDIENKDFRLKAGSPAIDNGVDLGYMKDFNNKTVPIGNAPDMGAFEFDASTGNSSLKLKNNEKPFSLWPNPTSNRFSLLTN